MAGIIEELKRRNVFKVGTAYVVLAWLLAQAADIAAETFVAPDWVMKMLVTMLALALPLVLFFAWAYELTPEGIKKERDVDRSQSITHQTGRKLDYTIIAILALALGYFIWESRFEKEDLTGAKLTGTVPVKSVAEPDEVPAAVVIDPKSIAVLPFVNMSSDPEQEYFSDGISEEILNALARVEDLKVAGRTSSFAFKGKNEDLRTIGKALRVANILEGSVRKSGNKLRITAQLIKVDDGYHLWSETFDREMTDVFAIQDEISNSILVQLKAKLLGGEQITTKKVNPEAYAQYLLAKQRIYDRSQASLELAAELLNKAIDLDPGFAAAHAQLGIATILLSEEQYGNLPDDQAYQRALQHLQKALSLDAQQAEALAGMGLYYGGIPGKGAEAIKWLRKSLASDPNQANASNWLANGLSNTGALRESLALREKDFARDPLYMPVFSNLVQRYSVTGQHEEARKVLDNLQPYLHDDANMSLTEGIAYQVNGDFAKADLAFTAAYKKEPKNYVNRQWLAGTTVLTAQYERAAELGVPDILGLALSRLGRTEEALIAANKAAAKGNFPGWFFQTLVENGQYSQLISYVESRYTDLAAFEQFWPSSGDGYGAISMAFIAEAYARLGEEEKFIDALERARAGNDSQLAEGADNWSLSLARAQVATLSGEYDSATDLLQRATDQGLVMDLNAPTAWPVFKPLHGDPRFEAVRTKITEHLNSERAALGLESVSA